MRLSFTFETLFELYEHNELLRTILVWNTENQDAKNDERMKLIFSYSWPVGGLKMVISNERHLM